MLWLFLSLSLSAHAKTVFLQGPQTSPIEYQAMLKSHSELISPVQHYLTSHPTPANRERLLTLFAQAQHAFLSKSNEEAAPKFAAITQLATSDDWARADREVFLQAYLRLAQMEDDPAKRDKWLGQSLILSDAGIASELYPPPLLARREELEHQTPKRDFSRKLRAQGWSEILIAGRSCGKNECGPLSLYPGRVRVTLLAEQLATVTKVVELADLEKVDTAGEGWAAGGCEQATLSEAAKTFGSVKVFWGLNCRDDAAPAMLTAKRVNTNEPLPVFTTAAPPPKKFYQSAWFWAGAGVVIAAIVFASSPQHESKEPTTSYGY